MEDGTIRRRRICEKCGAKFTTVERVQLRDLLVKKSDGSIQPFDRNKLKRSIQIACRHRDVPDEEIETITTSIHRQVEANVADDTVPSDAIGNIVSESLLELDPVAFIRFVSVYRKFSKVSEFKNIIAEIYKRDDDDRPKDKPAAAQKFENGKLF